MLRYKSLILMLLRQQMGHVGRLLVPVLNLLPIHELRLCFHTFPGDGGVIQASYFTFPSVDIECVTEHVI